MVSIVSSYSGMNSDSRIPFNTREIPFGFAISGDVQPGPSVDRLASLQAFRSISGQDGNNRDAFTPAQLLSALSPAVTQNDQGQQGFTRDNFVSAFSGLGVREDLASGAFTNPNLAGNGDFLPLDAVVNVATQFANPQTGNWNLPQFRNVLNAVAEAGAPQNPTPGDHHVTASAPMNGQGAGMGGNMTAPGGQADYSNYRCG